MKWLKNVLNSNHRLGFRIIKTGMAVTICVALSYVLRLDYPFYAAIAAVIAMEKSIDMSFKAGKNRIIGTFIGAFIGMLFAMIDPGNIGLCGIGVILTLYCCHFFRLHSSSTIACIVFSAIMLNLHGAVPWIYALNRIMDTFIGILVALLVNILIMPPNYVSQIKSAYSQLSDLIRESIDHASTGMPIDIPFLESSISRLSSHVTLYIAETRFLRGNDDEIFLISQRISIFKEMQYELRCIESLEERPVPQDHALRPVFEYHLNRLLALYDVVEEPA